MKWILLLCIGLTYQPVHAQNDYTPTELEHFVKVYMTHKTLKNQNRSDDQRLFTKYQVTPGRYKEIAKARVHNQKIELTAQEKQLLQAISEEDQKTKINQQNTLKSLCQENKLAYETYQDVLEHYKKDIAFQRSLKPYFQAFINGKK